MPIRVASKSVRCTTLLRRVLQQKAYQGIMCFTADEALFLLENDFDDLLMGYPVVDKGQIESLIPHLKAGKELVFMVDLVEHLQLLDSIGQSSEFTFDVCIDIDMSSTYPGLHFGVRRSSIRNEASLQLLLNALNGCPALKLRGIMGYEAQVAGLGDANPNQKLKSRVIQYLKKRSVNEFSERRKKAVDLIRKNGFEIDLVNGGGTGSIESTIEEPWVSEVTAGSGFYAPHLFDYYIRFRHLPAAAYAVQIVRRPSKNIYTCLGGGYIASGGIEAEKAPIIYLPEKARLDKNEGAGEVQTPVFYDGNINLNIGDPIFLRHSKAGELCERFNELYLISGNEIVDVVPTYRGEGKCFL